MMGVGHLRLTGVLRPDQPLRQASLAIAVAGAVTLGWLYLLGHGWRDLESAAARALSTALLAQARVVQALGGEAGKQFSTALFDMAGQAREMARLLPVTILLALPTSATMAPLSLPRISKPMIFTTSALALLPSVILIAGSFSVWTMIGAFAAVAHASQSSRRVIVIDTASGNWWAGVK